MFINYCFKNLVPSVNNVIYVIKKKSAIPRCLFKDLKNAALSRFLMFLYLMVLNLLLLDLVRLYFLVATIGR